jgi:4-alpha-glucanotransferase
MSAWTQRSASRLRDSCHAARRALGIDDLVLAVHDASFPSDPDEDVGRGSPYSRSAARLIRYADALGFTGLQLGPQGITTRFNRSPYDGTVFSRSPLSIALQRLADDPAWCVVFSGHDAGPPSAPLTPGRACHDRADEVLRRALDGAFRRIGRPEAAALRADFARFRAENASWLDHDAAFESCAMRYRTDDPARWPAGAHGSAAGEVADRYAFAQFVVHSQHAAFRAELRALGWKVLGDLQVGLSPRDGWLRRHLFLDRYAMGAPPSRTDPQGQPWGYAVLRPDSAVARDFLRARVRKVAREYDGVRVDHPHGLVCPWVYASDTPDPFRAVVGGARLFESPDLPDHPELARYAIARPDQLDRDRRRYDDHWVRALEPAQIERYGDRLGMLLDEIAATGGADVICEVLSTAPLPLASTLRRFGLGRFRVTQKADLARPDDGYRSENAQPEDWIMVGTHDTPPLALVIDRWAETGALPARAAYLAERLTFDADARAAQAASLATDRRLLARAQFADLLASPARHVLVFMSDFFGMRELYNRPGVVSDDNWTLRLPDEFERLHASNIAAGRAMDVPAALALALRARQSTAVEHAALIAELEAPERGGPAPP